MVQGVRLRIRVPRQLPAALSFTLTSLLYTLNIGYMLDKLLVVGPLSN